MAYTIPMTADQLMARAREVAGVDLPDDEVVAKKKGCGRYRRN